MNCLLLITLRLNISLELYCSSPRTRYRRLIGCGCTQCAVMALEGISLYFVKKTSLSKFCVKLSMERFFSHRPCVMGLEVATVCKSTIIVVFQLVC